MQPVQFWHFCNNVKVLVYATRYRFQCLHIKSSCTDQWPCIKCKRYQGSIYNKKLLQYSSHLILTNPKLFWHSALDNLNFLCSLKEARIIEFNRCWLPTGSDEPFCNTAPFCSQNFMNIYIGAGWAGKKTALSESEPIACDIRNSSSSSPLHDNCRNTGGPKMDSFGRRYISEMIKYIEMIKPMYVNY